MDDDRSLQPLLARLADGATLSDAEAETAFEAIMSGQASAAQVGAFLMALRLRGETVGEITAAARVLRARALKVAAPIGTLDTCGTGGDASGSYNISTAAALVIAACGVPVAKHGNRSVSSKSGSADVLTALGVDINAREDLLQRCLWDHNLCFLMAPRHHAAMRHVAPMRQELGMRTLFNLLGPLVNPAGAQRQLVGVYAIRWLMPLAETLGRLGSERAWVVHGDDGLDELTVTGASQVAEWREGSIRRFQVTPEMAGLRCWPAGSLKGGDAEHNAAALRRLLQGETGAYRDIVLLNSAAALVISDRAADLAQGAAMAAAAIDQGRAQDCLDRLVSITRQGGTA